MYICICVYGCVDKDRESFDKVRDFVDKVRDKRGDKARIVLIANKCDLSDQRQVSTQEAAKLTAQCQLDAHFECSATINRVTDEANKADTERVTRGVHGIMEHVISILPERDP